MSKWNCFAAGWAVALIVFLSVDAIFETDFSSPPSGPGDSQTVNPTASDTPALTFNKWLDAIEQEESGGDANAKGDLLDGVYRAIGSFQIWPIYVDEVNRICGLQRLTESFTYEDRLDRVRSRRMSLIHNQYWANFATMGTDMNYDEAFVRSHQGAGGYKSESTKAYWLRVKARMEKEN